VVTKADLKRQMPSCEFAFDDVPVRTTSPFHTSQDRLNARYAPSRVDALQCCAAGRLHEAHLSEQFNGSGGRRRTADEHSSSCLLHQWPHKLASLGLVGFQRMALIAYDHPKAAAEEGNA